MPLTRSTEHVGESVGAGPGGGRGERARLMGSGTTGAAAAAAAQASCSLRELTKALTRQLQGQQAVVLAAVRVRRAGSKGRRRRLQPPLPAAAGCLPGLDAARAGMPTAATCAGGWEARLAAGHRRAAAGAPPTAGSTRAAAAPTAL